MRRVALVDRSGSESSRRSRMSGGRNRQLEASLYSASWSAGMLSWEQGMTIDARSDLDHELAQLLREWVAAYETWTQVAEGEGPTSPGLTDEQRT
jgi:hypothetical protein